MASILLPFTENVSSYRQAEDIIEPIVPYFAHFTEEEANIFATRAADNGQIWSAHKCRTEFLPEFLRLNSDKIEEQTLKELKYQVENNRIYRDE